MATLLNDEVIGQVQEAFQELEDDVQVLFFEGEDCQYCDDTRNLTQELADLTGKIDLEVYHLEGDQDIAQQYNVDKVPGLVIASKNGGGAVDHGIRYAGIPAGHEFSSLIQDLLMVSSGEVNLQEDTLEFLGALEEPLHLQVFVTTSCPHCPRAVFLAHRLAFASDKVQAEMVESSEFMDLAQKYQVSGVPDTSINHGQGRVVGAVPEDHMINEIKKALEA